MDTAKEGGTEILIPVTIDDYVYKDWNPKRSDIATQIRARVISKFPNSSITDSKFVEAAEKLIVALKK